MDPDLSVAGLRWISSRILHRKALVALAIGQKHFAFVQEVCRLRGDIGSCRGLQAVTVLLCYAGYANGPLESPASFATIRQVSCLDIPRVSCFVRPSSLSVPITLSLPHEQDPNRPCI